MEQRELEEKTKELRRRIMEVGYKTQSGHLSSALSCTELVTALYYGGFLNIDKSNYQDGLRNRFLFSKGHACIIQYIILADLGIIDEAELWRFCRPDGILGAHPDYLKLPGIEATTGSLGHGLAYAIGVALGAKLQKRQFEVYTILGDGECQEGSVWESALCAGNHQLDNLTVIVDYNKLQASEFTSTISDLSPLADKWRSFNFDTQEIDGNDMGQVLGALHSPHNGRPKAIVANTLKGKGVSIMENQNGWHGRKPNDSEWPAICAELGI